MDSFWKQILAISHIPKKIPGFADKRNENETTFAAVRRQKRIGFLSLVESFIFAIWYNWMN